MSFKTRHFLILPVAIGGALGLYYLGPEKSPKNLASTPSSPASENSPVIQSLEKTISTPDLEKTSNAPQKKTPGPLETTDSLPGLLPDKSFVREPTAPDLIKAVTESDSVPLKQEPGSTQPLSDHLNNPSLTSTNPSALNFRSAPGLHALLTTQGSPQNPQAPQAPLVSSQESEKGSLSSQKPSPMSFDKSELSKISTEPAASSKESSPSSELKGLDTSRTNSGDPRNRLLGINSDSPGNASNSKKASKSDDPNPSQKGEGDPAEEDDDGFGKPGPKLSLAKPYCFLLPKSSPALQCAKESVKAIVEEYARADVQVIPVFRWWGDDYSKDPDQLEKEAKEACNLEAAFPWTGGGDKAGSIQVFTVNSVPNEQCPDDPERQSVAGCSNTCPKDGPSFSTVSQDKCNASVSVHESGHSNCCGKICHNQDDAKCEPEPIPGGCGLCMKGGAENAFLKTFGIFLAGPETFDGKEACSFTAEALASIRQGAAPNPGYAFQIKQEYRPQGKQYDSIYGKNGIRKLLASVKNSPISQAPPKNLHDNERGNGRSAASTDDSGKNKRRQLKNPKTYTPEQIRQMVGD